MSKVGEKEKKKTKTNKNVHGGRKHGGSSFKGRGQPSSSPHKPTTEAKKKKIKKPKHLKRKLEKLMQESSASNDQNGGGGNTEQERIRIEKQMKKLEERKAKRAAAFERKVRDMAGNKFDEEIFKTLREKGASVETILQATGAKPKNDDETDNKSKNKDAKHSKTKKNENSKNDYSSGMAVPLDSEENREDDKNDDTVQHIVKRRRRGRKGKDQEEGDEEMNKKTKQLPTLEQQPKPHDNDTTTSMEEGKKKDDTEVKTSKDKIGKNESDKVVKEANEEHENESPHEPQQDSREGEEDGGINHEDTETTPYRRTRENKKEWDHRYCVGRKPVTDFPIGSKHDGTVIYTKPFGVFIDIGCHSDAFCHISRVSDDYVESIDSMMKVGDKVTGARIVEIDRKHKRITVSLQSDNRREDEQKSINDRKIRQKRRDDKKHKKNKKKSYSNSSYDENYNQQY